MAEYKDLMNEKTPKKQNTSITQKADSQRERISEVSNVSRTVSTMQKKLDQQLAKNRKDVQKSEDLGDMRNAMLDVLGKMNQTMGNIGRGFVSVASSTAKASSEMVKGIGSALTEDLRLNKQNMVAMALSKTSPIFGYFVSRFMQTEAFQKAKERIKIGLADALGSVTEKFRSGFKGFISKLKFDKEKRGGGERNALTSAKRGRGDVQQLHSGGTIVKGGLFNLKAGEAVLDRQVMLPTESLLQQVDKKLSLTQEITSVATKAQIDQAANLKTYVKSSENFHKVGLFRGFLKALGEVQNEYTEPSNIRMLRAVLAIQDTVGGTIGTWPQVFQKMLVQHPFFRHAYLAFNTLKKSFGIIYRPIFALFRSRGGGLGVYKSHLAHSGGALNDMSQNIGTFYMQSMYRLDNIAKFTRATAEASMDLSTHFTGKKYPKLEGINTSPFTMFRNLRKFVNTFTGYFLETFLTKKVADFFTKKDILKGTGDFVGKFVPWRIKGVAEELKDLFWDAPKRIISTLKRDWKEITHPDQAEYERKADEIYGAGAGSIQGAAKGACLDCDKINKFLDLATIVFESLKNYMFPETIKVYEETAENGKQQLKLLSRNHRDMQKLLGYTNTSTDLITVIAESTSEVANRDKWRWLREKKEKMFDWFKNMGSWIMMGLSWASSFISGLPGKALEWFTKTLGPAISTMMGPAMTALGPLLLKGMAVAGVGLLAYQGTKWLLEELGFYDWFKSWMSKEDERTRQLVSIVTKQQTDSIKKARTDEGEEGYKSKVGLSVGNQISMDREKYGKWSGNAVTAIQAAQRKYSMENIGEYINYDVEEINRLRKEFGDKWQISGGMRGYDPLLDTGESYGIAYEQRFIEYLKKHGKPMTTEEAAKQRAAQQTRVESANEAKKLNKPIDGKVKSNLTIGELAENEAQQAGYLINRQVSALENKAEEIKNEYTTKYGPKVANLVSAIINPTSAYWDKTKQNELYKNLAVELEDAKKQYGPEAERMVSELQSYMNQMTQSAMELTQPQVKSIMAMLQDKSGKAYRKFMDEVDPQHREKVKELVKSVEMEMSKLASTEVSTLETAPDRIIAALKRQGEEAAKNAAALQKDFVQKAPAVFQNVINSPTVVDAKKTAVNAGQQVATAGMDLYKLMSTQGMGSTH